MKIPNKTIQVVRSLYAVAQNKDKKDYLQYLEGYGQALEDFKNNDENYLERLSKSLREDKVESEVKDE